MAKGYLLRRQVGTERGKPAYAYRLNWDPKVEVGDPETGPPNPGNESGAGD
jgi:hypothetical protein